VCSSDLGIGETIEPIAAPPSLAMVLVNPGVAVSTPAVFRALVRRDNPPLPVPPSRFADAEALLAWLAATRNDLQAPAIAVAPAIGEVLAALGAAPGCRLARMSGSGATCFGVFADAAAAEAAAGRLAARGWWTAAGSL
jgi:4-diphosphocytidyl-2-C-methyl-D-erythritol kinase